MALDKQSILNELGSVMNKLQSADCGCMGKMFSNQGGEGGATMGTHGGSGSFGGCRGGCCHGHGQGGFNFGHGFGSGAGEPCMGKCNPQKMYADTYSYLNSNLMQPVVNEVYSDLKSLTPENTVMNNSAMAAKMGMTPQGNIQGGNPMQGGNAMQGRNPITGGNPMQGGNAMYGGNSTQEANYMQGGNTMQGGNGVYGGNGLQESYPMEGGKAMFGGAPMQQSQMTSGGMGYQMQESMQGNAQSPQVMQGGGFGSDTVNQRMMGGMGPNIMDMMKSGRTSSSPPQTGQMPGQMLVDAPQSPHGKVGVAPLNATGGMYYNAEGGMHYNPNQQLSTPTTQYVTGADMNASGFNPNEQNHTGMNAGMHLGQGNLNMQQGMADPNMQQGMANPNMQQGMANPNMQQGMANPNMQQNTYMQQGQTNNSNMQQGLANPNAQQGQIYSNPTTQQIAQPGNRNYGMHSQGMKKFNEMFPGVMGGDLGFDPMAIALQMNPENHKRNAMDAMNRLMSGNKEQMAKALAGGNAAVSNLNQQKTEAANQKNGTPSGQAINGQPGMAANTVPQNQPYGNAINAQAVPAHQVPQQQQQVYYETNAQQPAYTGVPAANQGQVPSQQQYQYQQQQMVDPNTGAPVQQNTLAANGGATNDPNAQMQQPDESAPEPQLMIQDPIFPADISRPFTAPLAMRRQKFYQYNTLGQPITTIPAKMYQSLPETNLQQTLYPQPPSGKLRRDISRLNIKSTVSKTSLMGNRPVGITPSRSQLQNVYHQYKGSHSHTQQQIRNPSGQHISNSEGKLGAVQQVNVTPARQAPVERVGGDTAANNQPANTLPPVKEFIQERGDVPKTNKPRGDMGQAPQEMPKMQGNTRNGLQDMVYTAYPTTAAWSFHGEGGMPCYRGYRGYRARV